MKRMTDTDIWKKAWFMDLTPTEKLAWFYIKDQCDNVGVWTPNYRLAEFVIGSQLDWDKFAGKCNDNIYILDNGKWWIVDFCFFQHKDLVENPDGGKSKALQSYVRSLKEHGIYEYFLEQINGHSMGIERAPDGHTYAPKARLGKGKGKVKVRDITPFGEINLDKIIEHWNTYSPPLPRYRYLSPQLFNAEGIGQTAGAYSQDEIVKAIDNYATVIKDRTTYRAQPEYTNLSGFLAKGVEKYCDDAYPFDRCKIRTYQDTEAEKERERKDRIRKKLNVGGEDDS